MRRSTNDIQQLDRFHLHCLRRIAHIQWQSRTPNTDVLEKCKTTGIEAFLLQARLRWIGHVAQMPDDHIPKALFLENWRLANVRLVRHASATETQSSRHWKLFTSTRRLSKNWQPIEAAGGAPSDLAVSALRTEFMSPENNDVQGSNASGINSTVHHQTLKTKTHLFIWLCLQGLVTLFLGADYK